MILFKGDMYRGDLIVMADISGARKGAQSADGSRIEGYVQFPADNWIPAMLGYFNEALRLECADGFKSLIELELPDFYNSLTLVRIAFRTNGPPI
jgi:hypothetical protein